MADRYDGLNTERIATLLPHVAERATMFLMLAQKRLDKRLLVTQARRTMDEQAALWALGRTITTDERGRKQRIVTNAAPGFSYHNFGRAFDVCFLIGTKASWDRKLPWRALGGIGKELGFGWGGDFRSIGGDLGHFEWTDGKSLAQIRAAAKDAAGVPA